jgi:amidohydrolase
VDEFVAAVAAQLPAELTAAVELRHRLHADPRLSGQEDDTAKAIVAAVAAPLDGTGPLDGAGALRPERVARTGRLMRLGPASGPSVALRAELDALPITEQTGLPYASRSTVMHACGHDLHCAALTAVARAVRRVQAGGVVPPAGLLLVLQPREEAAPTGAGDVLADPAFGRHDVRAVIGAHVQPVLPRGLVSARPGAVNAACDELLVTVSGRGGHAAYPHRADDPVLALSAVVVALHHLVSRRVDPLDSAVLTIGRLDAGTASNVIPPAVRAHGTIRALDEAVRVRLREAVGEVVEHTSAAYGCTGTVTWDHNEPVLANDPVLAAGILPALAELGLGPDVEFRSCGSDDFANYSEALPSAMLFVGVGVRADEDIATGPGLHDARFAPPDEVVGELARAYLAGLSGALGLIAGPADRRPATGA